MTIQNAINLIKTACTQWNLGYDQSNRLDFRNGGETDCSALVILTCEQAGLLRGNNIRKGIGATFTGNMRANFKDRGWRVLSNLPVSQLKPGDVLLNDADHTAMYVGNGQIAYASIDEHGTATGGKSGDQAGGETLVGPYFNFPWSCVLRYRRPVPARKPVAPGAYDEPHLSHVFGHGTTAAEHDAWLDYFLDLQAWSTVHKDLTAHEQHVLVFADRTLQLI